MGSLFSKPKQQEVQKTPPPVEVSTIDENKEDNTEQRRNRAKSSSYNKTILAGSNAASPAQKKTTLG